MAKQRIPRFPIRVGAALLALWVLYVSINVAFPAQGEQHGRSDAVVSLLPQCHRLYTIQRVSVNDYCEAETSAEVICFTPEEVATIGEAFEVRDLVEGGSWESLTVVTSRTHAFRAHYIFDRCVGEEVEINLVHADPEFNVFQWARPPVYESAAFIKALLQASTRG